MTWTKFMGMHSGGDPKEPYAYIYIEAPENEAISVFYARFGHSPSRVTCTCCGEDYSISTAETLEQVTGFERGCLYERDSDEYVEKSDKTFGRKYVPMSEYLLRDDVLVIRSEDIHPAERLSAVPPQGYMWVD
jgi:hypothetical protein